MSQPPLFCVTEADPDAPAWERVRWWLRERNLIANPELMRRLELPEHRPQPLTLLAFADGEVTGGLVAEIHNSWLKVHLLAVDPKWRARGIGTGLLADAERLAVARGCRSAFVDTMEYQAPAFYAARGYVQLCEIPDADGLGHAKFYFMKRLT